MLLNMFFTKYDNHFSVRTGRGEAFHFLGVLIVAWCFQNSSTSLLDISPLRFHGSHPGTLA